MRLYKLFEKKVGHDTKLTAPDNTVVVDTPSDLDWYKLGQHFPTLANFDPNEFGAGGSDTVITFANKAEADKFRALMARTGVMTRDIGQSKQHPEIHTKNPGVDETIRKVDGDNYRLYSKKGKNLGTYDTKAGAEKREKQVNYFKHTNEGNKLELPDLEVGDEVKVGKFKNRKAEITGFDKDEHNQPVMKTTKGDQKVFKNRHSKLDEITMDHRTSKGEFDRSDLDEFIDRAYPVGNVKGYKIFLFDEDEPEEMHYLVGDPNSEGFLGYVSLIFGDRDKFYRTNVFFDPEIQGKGLAVPLYAFAIKHSGQTVVSDLTQTKGSKLLWQKLAKTPGINVYGWDTDKDEYFHWDPDTDEENEVWQDTRATADEVAEIRKKMVAIHNDYEDGKMSKEDYESLTKQYKDEADAIQSQRQNYRSDIRLVATTK